MARRMQVIFLGLTCLVSCADAVNIQPDWDALTDFSTQFSARMGSHDDNEDNNRQIEESVRGELNLDVFSERLFVKFSDHESFSGADHLQGVPEKFKFPGHAEGSFYFDGVQGHAVLRLQATVDTRLLPMPGGPGSNTVTVYPSCVNVGAQLKGMVPPPEIVKMQVEQMEPMISAQLNQLPHKDVTVGGESVAVFVKTDYHFSDIWGREAFTLKHDATPVHALQENHRQDEGRLHWSKAEVNFTRWTHGAKIPDDDVSCTTVSVAELVATPHGQRALRQLDSLMEILRFMKPLDMPFKHFPSKPSLLFEAAASVELSAHHRAEPGMVTMTVAGAAAGALASLLVFALVAAMKKPRRPTNGTPLLAEAAA